MLRKNSTRKPMMMTWTLKSEWLVKVDMNFTDTKILPRNLNLHEQRRYSNCLGIDDGAGITFDRVLGPLGFNPG